VYTAYLSPSDYGCIAILDFTSGILAILIGSGMGSALARYHFEARNEVERDQLWWTGLTFVGVMATIIVLPLCLGREMLSRLTLGAELVQGGYYYTLVLGTLWFGIFSNVLQSYLRVRKWSQLFVGISLASLFLNIGLNLYLLIVLKMGIPAVLIGNLLTAVVKTILLFTVFVHTRGSYRITWLVIQKLWRVGSPLIITALLSTIMHQADRYFLRLFLDLNEVGIYALAYTIGQAVNTLYLLPFDSIWSVAIYETSEQPNARHTLSNIFQYFIYGLMILMLGVSLFVVPILTLVVDSDYAEAANLIPVICLAYFFFSLHSQFSVPVLIAKQTITLLPASIAATLVNIVLNLIMIPLLGIAGAAWASVLTFFTFSFVGLWYYRKIDKLNYPFLKCGMALAGVCLSYFIYRFLSSLLTSHIWSLSMGIAIWLFWATLLLGPKVYQLSSEYGWKFRRKERVFK
jgi:O-antigen/teichoic acid export membrane protein